MPVVIRLNRRVDAQQQRDVLRAAISGMDGQCHILLWFEILADAADVEGFIAAQSRDEPVPYPLAAKITVGVPSAPTGMRHITHIIIMRANEFISAKLPTAVSGLIACGLNLL